LSQWGGCSTGTSARCIAHCLALAASQAGKDVQYISNTFKPALQQLFCFYENSAVRMAGLRAIEQLLLLACILLESFDNFPVDPYYEPPSWFMILYHLSQGNVQKSVH